MDTEPQVINNQSSGQFEVHVEGHVGVLTYGVHGGSLLLSHTEVPKPIGGRGLAARLTMHALGYAKEQGLSVLPVCPYVAQYIRDHPEHVVQVPANLHRSFRLVLPEQPVSEAQ